MGATGNSHFVDAGCGHIKMRGLPNLISELIRAANNVERVPEDARLRLLCRAYVTILQARDEIESQVSDTYRQAGVDLISATGHVGTLLNHEVRSLLLDAAEMIRQIKIVIDLTKNGTGDGR